MTRCISFEGIVNSRDLGGIVNAEGKTIRPGLLLRTANLSQATERDLLKLQSQYRVALVIDFRTGVERRGHPDRLPDRAAYLCQPIFDEATAGITREDGAPASSAVPDMVKLYRTMVSEAPCRKALSAVLTAIFAHDYESGAALWHCTAGKDRCGVVSALVLAALGVDHQEIMRDYAVNDDSFIVQADALYRRALRSGRPEHVAAYIRDVFLAVPAYMESAFSAIDEEFGSSEQFLTDGLGIPTSLLSEFRHKLLV